jgi:PRTRC genetic system ThiF family protein
MTDAVNGVHMLNRYLIGRRIEVTLAGVGGNGSQMLYGLARLDLAMRALGHPYGLHVTAFDADDVSEANVGRNLWSPADVGQNKAVLAVTRLNAYYGLDFDAWPYQYDAEADTRCDLLISCVDSRASRRAIADLFDEDNAAPTYWMDLGNTDVMGQVVLGEVDDSAADDTRLPCITELFPEVADTTIPEVNWHSCSLAMSLASQGLFVNDFTSRMALEILKTLFTRGQIRHHGALVNLDSMKMSPIPVSAAAWRRLGYEAGAAAKQRTEALAA